MPRVAGESIDGVGEGTDPGSLTWPRLGRKVKG